jgi:1,2-phenylacetyl-CoA epoxidase PaaB subunit
LRKTSASPRPRSKLARWEIIRVKGPPARPVGHVFAADEKAALKGAIEQFQIRQADRPRLLARRA